MAYVQGMLRLWMPGLVACCVAVTAGRAAERTTAFPFTIPWDDGLAGTATDVSFLNDMPAGTHGRILSRDGRFVYEQTGESVRFLGVNFTGKANFPTHEEADKVARHLAKYGINLVRLHHMDNAWDIKNGTAIWDSSDMQHRQKIGSGQLDKLDYLVAQFKKNGIYVNINLKVSKSLSAADGFPDTISRIPFNYQKRVDIFDRRMIELQKDYARQLLTHVNPYTGLSYADDPAVAMVEINNENSLVGDIWTTIGGGLTQMPEPWLGELTRLWNQWLISKYKYEDGRLKAAWQPARASNLPAVFSSQAKWILGSVGQTQAALFFEKGGVNSPVPESAVEVKTQRIDGVDYHLQLHTLPLNLVEGQPYVISFSAKSSVSRRVRVGIMRDRGDFRNNGFAASLALTNEWRDFSFTFTPEELDPGHVRLTFYMGLAASNVAVRNLKIEPGAETAGLREDQSLARANIQVPTVMSARQRRDWVSFLSDMDRQYASDMRRFLRNDLHVRANIIDTQIYWGGLTAYEREEQMDYVDNHDYWQHPSFPAGGWDAKHWSVVNSPMVSAWARGDKGTLDSLALTRRFGKPFSVSEYDHPAPSDYACEMMPLLSSFAAVQNWDAICTFDYGQYSENSPNNYVKAFFDQYPHVAKFALYPAAAMIFRMGLIKPAAGQRVLQVPAKPYESWTQTRTMWQAAGTSPAAPEFFDRQWGVELNTGVPNLDLRETKGVQAVNQSLRLDQMKDGAIFVASSPRVVVVTGWVGGQSVQAGDTVLTFGSFAGNFATATLTPMDGKPLNESHRVLMTVVGRAQNQNMGWNATRNSVGENWGYGPVQVDGIPLHVQTRVSGMRKIFALLNTGARGRQIDAQLENGALKFSVSPEMNTTWYELVQE